MKNLKYIIVVFVLVLLLLGGVINFSSRNKRDEYKKEGSKDFEDLVSLVESGNLEKAKTYISLEGPDSTIPSDDYRLVELSMLKLKRENGSIIKRILDMVSHTFPMNFTI